MRMPAGIRIVCRFEGRDVMIINLNVKIKGGPRTPINVEVYGTSINKKYMRLSNGKTISELEIIEYLQKKLMDKLSGLEL